MKHISGRNASLIFLVAALFCCCLGSQAQGVARGADSCFDVPMGWATCATHEGGTYPLRGGGDGRDTVVYNHGGDMRQTLLEAINRYDIVVLDGSQGAFTLSQSIGLTDLSHKTIIGRHDAVLQTAFVLTPDLHQRLDSARVKTFSSMAREGELFTLTNGRRVKEECEFRVRQLLIDVLDDPQEQFRLSGILSLNACEDIILRGITFQGPGAVDVSGKDLLTIGNATHHVWVDSCRFLDGMDGNFDITTRADFITVSRCTFAYTGRSYMHMNSNLIGSSDNAERNGDDCLNVTFARCTWGKGCDQRMPMVRFGKIHLLNCLYSCPGCRLTVNPRLRSEVLMEGCVWMKGVTRIFSATDATAYEFRNCLFAEPFTPRSTSTITMPYSYEALPPADVLSLPSTSSVLQE